MARTKGSKNKPKGEKAAKAPKAAKSFRKNTKTGATGDQVEGKAGAPAAAAAAPVTGSEVTRMTPGATLKSLLKTCRGLKQNMDQLNGSLREEIAYAKDKKNLHTGVFGLLRRFDKMEAEKASDFYHTLQYYLDASGIMAKIDSVGRLPMNDTPDSPADDAQADDGGETGGETGDEAANEAAEAAGHAAANGSAEASAPEDGKVSRPMFGQPRSQSEVADEKRVAALGNTKH